jgi:hypothetical protein
MLHPLRILKSHALNLVNENGLGSGQREVVFVYHNQLSVERYLAVLV